MIRREILFSSDEDSDDEIPRKTYKNRTNFNILNNFQHKEYFRLTAFQIQHVLELIGPTIRRETGKSMALDPQQQLLTTLHWLGNGGQLHGIAAMHGIAKSTVCRSINRVVNAIIEVMFQNVVRWPQNARADAEDFLRIGGFPSVCGCVDGTLINIDAPSQHEEVFVNRHGKHSLNVMMVCGPNFQFYAVNANWPGSVHDARVLRNSFISQRFEEGWRPFPDAVILGDSAYGIKEWLMTPLNRNPNDPTEQRYNRAHKSTRRVVENSFGILKERFPCLNHLRTTPERAGKVVLACAVLHNIAGVDENYVPMNEELGIDGNIYQVEMPVNVAAQNRLNRFLQYFQQ